MKPDYLTIDQAAEQLGLKSDTVRHYINEGKLTGYYFGTLLTRREVAKFEQKRRKPGRPATKKGRGE